MELKAQRASTLAEAAVTVAIVAIVSAAILGGMTMATHAAGANTVRDALQDAAERETRVAQDVLKYQGATLAPVTIATSIPMPTGSPLPAQLAFAKSVAGGVTTITITATAAQTGEQTAVTTQLRGQAPVPGTQVQAPGLAPAPTGAP